MNHTKKLRKISGGNKSNTKETHTETGKEKEENKKHHTKNDEEHSETGKEKEENKKHHTINDEEHSDSTTATDTESQSQSNDIFNETKNQANHLLGEAVELVGNSVANVLGYVPKDLPIQKKKEVEKTDEKDEKHVGSIISKTANNVLTGLSNQGADIIESINDTLDIKNSNKNITDAINNTTKIASDYVGSINKSLEDSNIKKEFLDTTKNLATYATIGLVAATPAIEKATEEIIDIGEKATEKIGNSAVKAGLDIVGVVPGLGEIVEGIRVVDDVAKAGLASVDAAADVVGSYAEVVDDTKKNFDKLLKDKQEIEDRINDSLEKFKKTTEKHSETMNHLDKSKKGGGTKRRKKNKTKRRRNKYTKKH